MQYIVYQWCNTCHLPSMVMSDLLSDANCCFIVWLKLFKTLRVPIGEDIGMVPEIHVITKVHVFIKLKI